ncbi:MAG: Methyltransferase-like protein 23, variant 2 [Marteilia pararefringens]
MTKRNVLKSLEGDKQKWERCRFKVFDWYDFQLLKTSNVKQFLNNEENESVFVLLSDCFYDRKHFEQLVCTLSFWNSCKMTKVYVCQEIRCPDWSIDCELELWNLFPERIIYSSSDDGKIFCTFIINKIIVQ